MPNAQLFLKIIIRAVWHRKFRSLVAVLAILLGTGVVGSLVNVYKDMNQKLTREFRVYGANLLLYPTDRNAKLDIKTVKEVSNDLPKDQVIGYAPTLYHVVNLENKPIVLVGTWMDQIKKVSPYWNVEGGFITDRENVSEAMVGIAVAQKYDLKLNQPIKIKADTGQEWVFRIKGIMTTGGAEDNQIFVNMKLVNRMFGENKADIVLVNLLEKGASLETTAAKLQQQVNHVAAKPIKQMATSEEKLLQKMKSLIYFVSVIIFVSTLLTVSTTMMSMMIERRKEVGLKKALGASDRKVLVEFVVEGGVIAIFGSTLGLILAYYLAQGIGESVFHSRITFQGDLIPWTYICSLVVIGIAFLLPMKKVMEVDPAIVLKGE